MITHSKSEDGSPIYHEGTYWMEVGGERNSGEVNLYHKCPSGDVVNDVLLVREVRDRKCGHCTGLEIPDDLFTLYVLLGGEGVHGIIEDTQ